MENSLALTVPFSCSRGQSSVWKAGSRNSSARLPDSRVSHTPRLVLSAQGAAAPWSGSSTRHLPFLYCPPHTHTHTVSLWLCFLIFVFAAPPYRL